ESGTPPPKPNPSRPYFTLGAVIIDADKWKQCHAAVHGYKVRNKIFGEVKWRYFAPHNTDKSNPMNGFDAGIRKKLSLDFSNIIGKLPIEIIACVTDIESAFAYETVNGSHDLYHFAYKPISERFQYCLQDAKDIGIVIADHRGRSDDKMFRTHHSTLTKSQSTNRSGYDRFIEGLFLQDSEHSTGIQLADYVTGAIHRAYSTGDGEHAACFKAKMRGAAEGRVMGRGMDQHPKPSFKSGTGRRAGS
ncbi:MAG: DUF3800 domain-containing protein, partial [Roseovarius sp.]|nr:DUF3800 domain-containing protein [Roseovarius sp.]